MILIKEKTLVLELPQETHKKYHTKEIKEEEIADIEKLLEKIENDDDVQNVYHTMS